MSEDAGRLHPVPDDQLLALASGELSGDAAEAVRLHLRGCPDCAALAESAAALHGVAAACGEEPLDDVAR